MITLDPTLKAAQDALIRAPICRINSSSFVDAIPFDGNYFNTSSAPEQHPYLIETSSGRLAMVITSGANLVYRYSDTEKIQFTDVILLSGSLAMYEAAIVEISTDVLGIIYADKYGLNVRMRSVTLSETGSILSSHTTIELYEYAATQIREVCVIKLATTEYLSIYRKTDIATTDQYLMKRTSVNFLTWSQESSIGI